jgi:signal transduction histidine kinase
MPDVVPPLRADRQELERVLLNLLSNAVRCSPDGGTVTTTVSVTDGGESVSIAVRDMGVGIPQ